MGSDAAGRAYESSILLGGGVAQGVLLPRPPVEGGDGCPSIWRVRRTISESVPDESIGGATDLDIGAQLTKDDVREQARFGGLLFAGFVAAAIVLSWLMFPFPI